MDTEQRLEKLERQNRNQRMALMLLTVAFCGVVTMAATEVGSSDNVGSFDIVRAKYFFVENEAGEIVVGLSSNDGGDGTVSTYSSSGKELVRLQSADGGGALMIFNKGGDEVIQALADDYSHGDIGVWDRKGEGRTLTPR